MATRLNQTARDTLAAAGISQAAWARRQGYADGRWQGDACGCPDDRCIGYHHEDAGDCGCLPALLEDTEPEGIVRPNGERYRPRKVIAHEVGGEDGITEGVLVLGTHDQARAQVLADQLAEYLLGSGYTAAGPRPGWYRDGFEGGRRTWVSDEVRGRAGIWFREIMEVPR